MPEYYHNLVTEKSFQILQQLQRTYDFVLIGGWAVFMWTKSLKSKDIDIVLDYPEIEKMRHCYHLAKNDRLRKYEAKNGEIDIDIYACHYSNPGLPAEDIAQYAVSKNGFRVPHPAALLILKQAAFAERRGSPKGEKDAIDIVSLLAGAEVDFVLYRQLLEHYGKHDCLEKLLALLKRTSEMPECNLNRHAMSRLKSRVQEQLRA